MHGPLVVLAALGWTGPAEAAEIDDSATWNLSASAEAPPPEERGRRHRAGKAARPSAAPARPSAAPARSTARGAPRPQAYRPAPAAAAPRPAPRPPVGSVPMTRTGVRPAPSAAPAPIGARPVATPRPAPPAASARPASAVRPATAPVVTGSDRPGGTPTVVTEGSSRPGGATVVHGSAVRPGGPVRGTTTVVTHAPPRSTVVVHHRPVRVQTVTYTHVAPYHGVFVYGPRPATHVTYVEQGPVQVAEPDLPDRAIDRDKTLAIGVMGGALLSATPGGSFYGDPGLGLVGRYRVAEPVALELGLAHHAASLDLDEKHSNTQVNGDVKLFAFPWTRVSPYALGGVTYNAMDIQEPIATGGGIGVLETADAQWGLDAGLGLELAMGNNFALDLQGKYIGWLDERLEGEAPGAFQLGGGLAFHFR